jgi:hypothetical protein
MLLTTTGLFLFGRYRRLGCGSLAGPSEGSRNMQIGNLCRTLAMIAGIVAVSWSVRGDAIAVQIDQYAIQKNGSSFFTDTFSNNLTPSQEPATYAVFGAYPNGAESGGQLLMNSDFGGLTANALGQARQTLNNTYLSSITSLSNGLTVNDALDFRGTFSLVTPPGPLTSGYGLQVADYLPGPVTDRLVELDVQYNANFGGDVIRFLLQDFVNGTIVTLGFVALVPPAGADQVMLDISRPNRSNGDFFGAYAFGAGGVFGPLTAFPIPGALFTNTDFVRGRFQAFTAVPEPGTLALFGIASALGLALRRRVQQGSTSERV